MKLAGLVFSFSLVSAMIAGQARADIINFDDQGLIGPSYFSATSPQTVSVVSPGGVGVTISGGTILTAASNLPANQTSIYGTAGFASPQGPGGYQNLITISFDQDIHNFIATLLNGSTITADFLATDSHGNTATFTLAPNTQGGQSQVEFAAAGNQVTITQLTNDPAVLGYDFLIDNIQFNVPLTAVPEPSTVLAFGLGGFAGLFGLVRKHRKSA